MQDLNEPKTTLEELKDEFSNAYRYWRLKAETFGIRFDEVELAWLKYVRARDCYINHRDKNLYN